MRRRTFLELSGATILGGACVVKSEPAAIRKSMEERRRLVQAESAALEMEIGDGWREIEPQATEYSLLLAGQELEKWPTSFDGPEKLGELGGGVCPIAVDETAGVAYRAFDKPERRKEREESAGEVRAYGLKGTGSRLVASLPKGATCRWLLSLIPGEHELIGLVPREGSQGSYLGRFSLNSSTPKLAQLHESAWYPLFCDPTKREIVFSGRHGGIHAVDFNGEIKQAQPSVPVRHIEGACKLNDDVVFGGGGLHVWHRTKGSVETIVRRGKSPVVHANRIWFGESDGELCHCDLDGSGIRRVVAIKGYKTDDTNFPPKLVFSSDGRMMFCTLTGVRPLTEEEEEETQLWCKEHGIPFSDTYNRQHVHTMCVLDMERKVLWRHPIYAHDIAWYRAG